MAGRCRPLLVVCRRTSVRRGWDGRGRAVKAVGVGGRNALCSRGRIGVGSTSSGMGSARLPKRAPPRPGMGRGRRWGCRALRAAGSRMTTMSTLQQPRPARRPTEAVPPTPPPLDPTAVVGRPEDDPGPAPDVAPRLVRPNATAAADQWRHPGDGRDRRPAELLPEPVPGPVHGRGAGGDRAVAGGQLPLRQAFAGRRVRRGRGRRPAAVEPRLHVRAVRDRAVQPPAPRRQPGRRRAARARRTTRCSSTAASGWARRTCSRRSASGCWSGPRTRGSST